MDCREEAFMLSCDPFGIMPEVLSFMAAVIEDSIGGDPAEEPGGVEPLDRADRSFKIVAADSRFGVESTSCFPESVSA